MKKFTAIITSCAVCAAVAGTALAETTAADLNDGTYSITVDSNNKMFKVTDCKLTVKDGKLTAAVTLSGTGYGKLFVGTGEQAAAAAESDYIPFEDVDGKYVYTFEITALDAPVQVAAWSTKNSEWYDRTLTFNSADLPAEALKNGAGASAPSESSTPSDAPSTDKDNPDSGFGTLALTSAVLAGAAVAVSRKKNK